MKSLLVVAVIAALSGCASAPRGPYAERYGAPADPSQWRVVSVTPVAPGTGARIAAANPDGKPVEYSSAPVAVQQAPVYVPAQPYYYPEPYYYAPPVSLSLGFVFGRHWGGHRHYRHRRR